MAKILIFGHKNPDTDTICSAISLSYLKKQISGDEFEAVRLGEINLETEFALNYFNVPNIRLIKDIKDQVVILVDHNERTQTADGFEEAKVIELVDHHKISNFNVSEPLYARVEPIGCTASIIYKMFKENKVDIPKEIAGIMLSAIISDTLLFSSPTCTKEDEKIALDLAKIAGVDFKEYGLEMLKKGSDLSSKTVEQILNMDMKEFEISGNLFAIAQVNTFDINKLLSKKQEFISQMKSYNKYNTYLFVITDVLKSTSVGLVVGNIEKVEKAFNEKVVDNQINLVGVVSRKKQVIPPLMK